MFSISFQVTLELICPVTPIAGYLLPLIVLLIYVGNDAFICLKAYPEELLIVLSEIVTFALLVIMPVPHLSIMFPDIIADLSTVLILVKLIPKGLSFSLLLVILGVVS